MSPPASIAEQLRAAAQLVHSGRFLQAEAHALQVLKRQPRNARAHYVLALSAVFQNRPADGLPSIDRAVAIAGTDPQFHFLRAMCLAGLGRGDDAIATYRKALELRPDFFVAWANLGNLLERQGRWAEAEEAYGHAIRLKPGAGLVHNGIGICALARGDLEGAARAFANAAAAEPGSPAVRYNLGRTLGKLKRVEDGIAHLREAVRLKPDHAAAWVNLGELCHAAGRDGESVDALDHALALDPANAGLRHLRDALAGVQTERAPDEYIRGFFDRFAADFDRRLTQDLEYRTPERLVAFLGPWLGSRKGGLRIQDLGCGTGLSGMALKPWAASLAGVDLSGQMLAKARERGLYDSLDEAEIAVHLDARPAGACDLAAAMDVFVYLGDLDPVFRAVTRSLAPGGMFAFSVERLEGEGDFRLAPSGRYAHSRSYLRALAKAHGLVEWKIDEAVIRKEAGRDVVGLLAGFTKA